MCLPKARKPPFVFLNAVFGTARFFMNILYKTEAHFLPLGLWFVRLCMASIYTWQVYFLSPWLRSVDFFIKECLCFHEYVAPTMALTLIVFLSKTPLALPQNQRLKG